MNLSLNFLFILAFCTIGTAVNASETRFQRKLSDGRIFEIQLLTQSVLDTNVDGNPFSKNVTQAMFLNFRAIGKPGWSNYNYEAVGLIAGKETNRFWTNCGSWSDLVVGLPTGFSPWDAAILMDSILICYQEQFDLYVERVPLPGSNSRRSRQRLCSDNPANGQAVTNAVFVMSNNVPVGITATGWLPVKEIAWKRDGDRFEVQTVSSNAWDIVGAAKTRQEFWIWKGNRWEKSK